MDFTIEKIIILNNKIENNKMMTSFESELSYNQYRRKSLFLSISDEMLKNVVNESVIILTKYTKSLIYKREFENLKKGYINKYIKSQIRNIKVISEYFFKVYPELNSKGTYDKLKFNIERSLLFLKDVIPGHEEKQDYFNLIMLFAKEYMRGIVYYSIVMFGLDTEIYNKNLLIEN